MKWIAGLAGLVVAVTVLGSGGTAVASGGSSAAAPPKYVLTMSASISSPAGVATQASVACPGKTLPYSGGVSEPVVNLRVKVNASFPSGHSWIVTLNNASAAATTFTVYVLCAQKPKGYKVVESAPVANPPGVQDSAAATCPAGTKVLGGGGGSTLVDLSVNLNSSEPVHVGSTFQWVVRVNNASSISAEAVAFAVCGKASGYHIIAGTAFTDPPANTRGSAATCPAGTVVFGGGGTSNSGQLTVNIDATFPSVAANGWFVYENNASPLNATVTPWVICGT